MLSDRILETLRFFDLQDYPLTLLEIYTYLLPEKDSLAGLLDAQHELRGAGPAGQAALVPALAIAECLGRELAERVECHRGFYCLKGRGGIIRQRLLNYLYGMFREKRVARFARGLKWIPFVRGAGLAGSQVLGQQKDTSDIDLFIITDENRMWLARTLVTAYFQVLGLRRHGAKVKNRFCLNHYVAGGKALTKLRNLYTALEYAKLRPLAGAGAVADFQKKNQPWISGFYPNWQAPTAEASAASPVQVFLEKLFQGKFGGWLETRLKAWQLPKIRTEKYILVADDELSFHPDSKQEFLLKRFFES